MVHIVPRNAGCDSDGKRVQHQILKHLGIESGSVRSSKLFLIDYPITEDELKNYAEKCLHDPVVNSIYCNALNSPGQYKSFISVAKMPGVTDDEGTSAQKTLADFLGRQIDTNTQHIFVQDVYFFEKEMDKNSLKRIAADLLGNKLINHFEYGKPSDFKQYVPAVDVVVDNRVENIDIFIDDDKLLKLSRDMVLSMDIEELRAIQDYYRDEKVLNKREKSGLPSIPTDCELEILAQTWSEHCKHKEFAAKITYTNKVTGETKEIDSLFKTYIKGSTEKIRENLKKNANDWLLKVFNDNAGVVELNKKDTFIWKVETHNSPSAIDPYGGAITGILGNNRDPLCTGIGGGRLLFNTNVLCFGDPYYEGELIDTQLHPRRIFEGVVKGIEDGGNKSGIPTVNGSIIFDERYAGKPLVYCGTAGIIPREYKGRNAWEKHIDKGDRIIMAGGRVGKDGIHGATFSSTELNEFSPSSAVQIGSPITQKLLADFLERATERGLIKCSTDNGAGGLSSSIGELATISNGAIVDLENVPLKYSGLKPWEVFLSESQERMSLVVEPRYIKEVFNLAEEMEVELTDIGEFSSDGDLVIRYDGKTIASLDLDFLHDGVPRKHMNAQWDGVDVNEPTIPEIDDYNMVLKKLLSSLNICSKEWVIRQYDHEVKGKSVLKPLMGDGNSPQDAAVVRTSFDSFEGVAVSNGIIPRYGDIDAYQMSAGSFDEAVRQIISAGGELPNLEKSNGIFWTVNDNFCVPDSLYDPVNNPDGKVKLAKLVQMCEALYDMSTFFDIPMTSGKDSMKNDFKGGGKKISVPPTILYSMAAKIKDVRRCVSSNFKAADDLVYVLGETYDELGGSEFYRIYNELGANVPVVRPELAKKLYTAVSQANRESLIESSHDISDGGLAVCLAECCFGTAFGVNASIDSIASAGRNAALFGESHSRFVVSVAPENRERFEEHFGKRAFLLGNVTGNGKFTLSENGACLIDSSVSDLLASWKSTLEIME
ncbi:MAG: phosphoribosylformylglycinamidine synthase [Spirochaetes bacterium]|nr:phosphoribosylformylglycinamidine synthase [Spirochaetota bacterium]MBN2769838.1 phosphoribosylformylglycinamidine synthase [Spirochaetota bacterium]